MQDDFEAYVDDEAYIDEIFDRYEEYAAEFDYWFEEDLSDLEDEDIYYGEGEGEERAS